MGKARLETQPIFEGKPLFQKPERRARKRKTYTLAPETEAILQAVVDAEDAPSRSRAIDVLANFYVDNSPAVHVHLDPAIRARLTQFFMSKGHMLHVGLKNLALDIYKNIST